MSLRADDGTAVAEFPLVAVLIIVIALAVLQAALIMHTRNIMIDAAVQGAHHAALVGSSPAAGADRAQSLLDDRLTGSLDATASAEVQQDGTIRVQISATLPVLGLVGPAGGLTVDGHALDERVW